MVNNQFNQLRFAILTFISSLIPFSSYAQSPNLHGQLDAVKRMIKLHPDSAYLMARSLQNQAAEMENEQLVGEAAQLMGNIAFYMGNYPQSFEHYHEAMAIFNTLNHRRKSAALLDDLGMLYYQNKQPDKAFAAYRKAMAIYQRIVDKNGIADTYAKIGHLYEKQAEYDSAFFYQDKALSIYHDTGHKGGLAKVYENLGSIYEDLTRYEPAQFYFEKANRLYVEIDDDRSRIEVINNLGDVYRKTGRYHEALDATRLALQLALQFQEFYQIESAYRDLGKTYHLLGQNDSAYYYLEQSREISRNLYSTENSQQTAFLQVLFDLEDKDDRIQELHNTRRIMLVAGMSFLIITMLLFWLFYTKTRNERKLKQKENHLLEAQNQLITAELSNKELLAEHLQRTLEVRSQELSNHTLYVIHKNQFLENLKLSLQNLLKEDKRDNKKSLKQIISEINQSFNNDKYWEDFRNAFEQVHGDFYERLSCHSPQLKANDFRLVALLKMNFTTDEIAALMGISIDSTRVARYRLRKKLQLDQQVNLVLFLQSF